MGWGSSLGNIFAGSGSKNEEFNQDAYEATGIKYYTSGGAPSGNTGGGFNWGSAINGVLDSGVKLINNKTKDIKLPTVQTEVQLSPMVMILAVGLGAMFLFGGSRRR